MTDPGHAIDKWLTTTPADKWHKDGCTCEVCHSEHDIIEGFRDGMKCCREEIQYLIEKRKWCERKPLEHCDVYMESGRCRECLVDQILPA